MSFSPYRLLATVMFLPQYNKFIRVCRNTGYQQDQAWRRIQKLLSKGSFWPSQVKNFSAMDLNSFKITEYDDYREALQQNLSLKISCLNGEKILFWSESSGTTGKMKFYPLTRSFQKEFQLVNGPFLYNVLKNNSSFLTNKTLYFASDKPSKKAATGIGIGFISGFNYERIPKLFKRKYGFPDEVFSDRNTFFKFGSLYALSEQIDTFIAITPSAVERMYREIELNREFYFEQIQNPKVPDGFPTLNFSESEIERIQNVLKKNYFSLQDLWPNLQTLVCWKTSTCGFQLRQMKSILGTIKVVDAIYSATEGWMTVPEGSESHSGGALHCGGHVYEFLEVGKKVCEENLIKPAELEVGKFYEIFLTTSMGFIRYRLRDILLCKGYLHQSPILEFHEKQGQSISIGHTRVSDVHLLKAIEVGAFQMPEKWCVICASDGKKLVLVLPESYQKNEINLASFDKALRQCNEEYDDDRKNSLLEPIQIKVVSNEFYAWSQPQHAQSKPKLILQGTIEI